MRHSPNPTGNNKNLLVGTNGGTCATIARASVATTINNASKRWWWWQADDTVYNLEINEEPIRPCSSCCCLLTGIAASRQGF